MEYCSKWFIVALLGLETKKMLQEVVVSSSVDVCDAEASSEIKLGEVYDGLLGYGFQTKQVQEALQV